VNYGELLNFLPQSLGFTLPDLMLLFTVLGCIILFAKDFKIGLMSLGMLLALEFIGFSLLGMETYKTLIAFLICLVLITLSLYTSGARQQIR